MYVQDLARNKTMATFPDSFTQLGDDSVISVESAPHQEDYGSGYAGYDPSQQFEYVAAESGLENDSNDDAFASHAYGNGEGFGEDFGGSDCHILPPPSEMESEEGVALREWRRLRSIESFDFF